MKKTNFCKKNFRNPLRGRKRKAPPPPSNAELPPPKKPPPKKRVAKKEKPKIYSTRDNFKANSQNEYTIRQPDYVESLHNFRLFFNDEKTRGIIFDFNNFKSKEGKNVKTPCLFLFNYWEEKAENIKFPDKDDGMFNFLKNSILFNFFPDVIIFV